jgi:hypothetical protein
MAIKTIPKISGPDFGGVIYGLNTDIGYSNSASKLTLSIVNANGNYILPTLNKPESVSFGNFSFNGVVWSYNLKESAGEKTLEVTLIDNSIILDRYYVLLWKRGFLGLGGTPQVKNKTFNFSDESILVPVKSNEGGGFGFTRFIERRLGSRTVSAESYSLGSSSVGNAIIVGREKFANSACDIPDTYYTFSDLNIPCNVSNKPSNNTWKATHEGTLRSVLSSWCSDLGFDYYWDFSSDTLVFYDVSRGISSIKNITASNIISKEYSSSMEGTFRHYGIAYTAMPKSPVKTISSTRNITLLYNISPYPVSYFINKIDTPQSITSGRERYGGKRNLQDFMHAAFLGFICRSLRDLFCFEKEHWEALGYTPNTGIVVNKKQIINALKKFGFQEMISDLESFDQKDLPNYDFSFISRDPAIADRWYEIEQELLQYEGRFYRSSDTSGSFFYCNSNMTIEVDITIDPESQLQEPNSEQFAGKRIIDRGGVMSHDPASAQEALGYEDLKADILKCAPIHIDLKESGILDAMITADLIPANQADTLTTLIIYPKSSTFVKGKIGFTSSLSRSQNNLERSITDIKNANNQNGRKNCTTFEDSLKKGSCQSAEEIARNEAIKAAGGDPNPNEDPDNYVSGLVGKTARSCQISLKQGSSVRIHARSDQQFQVVCRYKINANKIQRVGASQFIWSVGSPGGANDVAEIRISNENITDPDEDRFSSRRPGTLIRPANSASTAPQENIKYVFAGEPQDLILSPKNGLSSLDISLSDNGFETTVTFSNKPKKPGRANDVVRYVHSQFNRSSYNAS